MKEKAQNIHESGVELSEKLIRLSSLLRFMERRQAMEHGLTPLQNTIIQLCYEEEQKGNFLMPQILLSLLMISPATLSVALKTLEKKKLLHRYRSKEDKRSHLLQLSDWGREKAAISKVYLNPLIGILQPLPELQKKQLLNMLDGVVTRLEHALQ